MTRHVQVSSSGVQGGSKRRVGGRPEPVTAVRPLLEARKAIDHQVDDLDCKVRKLARNDAQVRRFMTVPISD